MLTPRFEISQTEDDITVTIHAPYANVAETEIFVDENHFRFYSPPYYLRLHLPGSVEETDASTGCYNADAGKFVVCVAKVMKGQHFPDLDLLTTLLAPRKAKLDIGRAGIEVLGEQCIEEDETSEESEWFLEQPLEEPLAELTGTTTYGFGGQSKGVFARFQGEISELLDVPNPDCTPACDRWRLQVEREKTDFCEMHYLADLMEPEAVQALLVYQPTIDTAEPLPEPLQSTLLQLPNREYLLSALEKRSTYLGLVDILFAYCYDRRITDCEPNSESAWNINKLSATLCWLQVFSNVEAVVLSSVRRSLVYPLYRSWDLAVAVLDDVQAVLCAGKKHILRCLLEIHSLFNSSELRYLFNRLYIQDYCIWVQQCPVSKFESVAVAISKCVPSKQDLDLDLPELEAAAMMVEQEQEEVERGKVEETPGPVEQVAQQLKDLHFVKQEEASIVKSTLSSSKTNGEETSDSGSSYDSESDSESSSDSESDSGSESSNELDSDSSIASE